jgi:hypothetical protein
MPHCRVGLAADSSVNEANQELIRHLQVRHQGMRGELADREREREREREEQNGARA